MALVAFHDLNGTELLVDDRDAVDMILGLAAGAITEDDLATTSRPSLDAGSLIQDTQPGPNDGRT